jgi:multicomponent Na+:H+ antiporter subunit F
MNPPVAFAVQTTIGLLSFACLLALYRVLRGPSLADRVVALDLMATLVAAITAVYAIYTETAVILDVAIIFALIAFLGTVAFAGYIERKERQ